MRVWFYFPFPDGCSIHPKAFRLSDMPARIRPDRQTCSFVDIYNRQTYGPDNSGRRGVLAVGGNVRNMRVEC